ncbi:MAG: hypothetical protein SRB1_02008 [Desulfobacteraceae bacterium Eth-SRB1]|nr:MAG: hypothetical protein SRB1_02008 [Desulfobacteraceae bacterium Eth-SRB1]
MPILKSFIVPIYMLFYRLSIFIIKKVSIGSSCYIKNTKFLGQAQIEDRCRISGKPKVLIGENFYLNAGCHLLGDIRIGDNVMIGPQTIFWGRDHGMKLGIPMNSQPHSIEKIVIENDVWIGANVTILKNVMIKEGAIVAAGAVVTKNVSSNTIVGGIPAKVIGKRK